MACHNVNVCEVRCVCAVAKCDDFDDVEIPLLCTCRGASECVYVCVDGETHTFQFTVMPRSQLVRSTMYFNGIFFSTEQFVTVFSNFSET